MAVALTTGCRSSQVDKLCPMVIVPGSPCTRWSRPDGPKRLFDAFGDRGSLVRCRIKPVRCRIASASLGESLCVFTSILPAPPTMMSRCGCSAAWTTAFATALGEYRGGTPLGFTPSLVRALEKRGVLIEAGIIWVTLTGILASRNSRRSASTKPSMPCFEAE